MTQKISKVIEINCNNKILIKAVFKPKLWEIMSPVKKFEIEFISPNVFFSKIFDEVKILKIPIEMEGELVLDNKGEDPGKGTLIEFNVRNNKDVKELEGRLRIKEIAPDKAKVGVFIHNFTLGSDFLNSVGKSATEMILRTKVTQMLRNLEQYCNTHDGKELL